MSAKHLQLAGTATIGPKGQVVIPAEVREKMGIKPGDKLVVLYVEDKQSVAFITENQAQTIIDKFDAHVTALRGAIED
ncbi:MAG TPA: AbrB/MazE/SpoVT family DNA-binding domain-containing protein [Patescibacteria group bacterium]|jgi:AbrB family looped-hinge helix DNA binding protein|nr:AbrB/MazE/SpoVT family DNA-binding domain-containing protein [Patescibacteria group bacterium]